MIKKYTRDTRKTLKAWNWKAPKAQASNVRNARETPQVRVRNARETLKVRVRNVRNARETSKAQTADTRYSYFDCLCDRASAPAEVNGSTLYQLLMVSCMVLFVFTANGVGGQGMSFFAQSR